MLLTLIEKCAKCKTFVDLNADDTKMTKVDSWTPGKNNVQEDIVLCSFSVTFIVLKSRTGAAVDDSFRSSLEKLSVSGCSLRDEHFAALHKTFGKFTLSKLSDVNLTNNGDVSASALRDLCEMTRIKITRSFQNQINPYL